MPDLDVTDLLVDPDFCEQITVIRNAQVVGTNGVSTLTPTTLTITAVVTAVDGDFVRQPDEEYAKNMILVHSTTRLRGVTVGNVPDTVVWKGNNYVVKRSNDWSNYGSGFTSAVCVLTDVTAEL